MTIKYFISGGSRFGEPTVLNKYGFEQAEDMASCDFVVFTGGADINPALYGEMAHHTTYYTNARDTREIADYRQAIDLGKAFLGICRGAQLLNVLAGGKLYQDIGHPSVHEIVTDTGERFLSNSVHHQMMRPGPGAIIKAWAQNLSKGHFYMREDGLEGNDPDVEQEPEIVVYPERRMVLVQGHPEFSHSDPALHTFRQFVFNLVKEQQNACAINA